MLKTHARFRGFPDKGALSVLGYLNHHEPENPAWVVGAKPVLFSQFADLSDMSREEALKRLTLLQARVALTERKSGMGTFRWSKNQELLDWSPGLYRILGFDPTMPPVPNALFALAHPDDREIFDAAFDSVMASPGPFYIRYRILRPDGAERHLEVSGDAETDEDGRMVAIVGMVQDITQRVETEEQLRSAMDAFRVLTDEANDLICRHDPSMGILYCSPALTRMLGYDAAEVLGNSFLNVIERQDRIEISRVHRQLLRPGASISVTTRMRHKDGHILWVETMCRSVGDPETGRVHEIITVSRDVTTRKAAEAEINKARETAESANRTKSRFLATMSHELRTPLNAIIGFSDMLKSELFGPLGDRYREYSELIHESGTLLLDLINDILDMSKIEAGKFELSMETFDTSETVEACLRLMKAKADQSGLTLQVDLGAGTTIEADKRALKQILLNLLSNAIKFTPRGGRVTTTTVAHDDHVALIVADTGIGIPAADLPRLGKPFEQAKQDANLTKAGTGLGLALVRSLAKLHGGDISIDSVEGRGTTVTVTLPKARMAAAA